MKHLLTTLLLAAACLAASAASDPKPWQHGRLCVSDNQRFLQHADGTPFFLLGETAWLMPQRLNRDEVQYYLQQCHEAGYNMVQVQVLNDVPSYNVYGTPSHTATATGAYRLPQPQEEAAGYWRHLDHIVSEAARQGIYVGLVCVWGSVVKAGKLSEDEARAYGTFMAQRYKDRPNIIWIMGGDIQGDVRPEVWQMMATTIKGIDSNHLMTFHPRGRTTSAHWWSKAPWIDFHSFQSGHRRYGQRMGTKDYPIPDGTEEDNWMYVDSVWTYSPTKPVIDDEPIYEGIPHGLHDANEPRWQACDVRRYAYWSVFAGACGHTYGNNAIMQFYRPGLPPAYHNNKAWYDALNNPGFHQMQHLKRLMLALPYFERVPDQSIICDNGTRYDRLIATRGNDYLLVYNYTSRPMRLDLNRISGDTKRVWWMDAATGRLTYLGEHKSRVLTFNPHKDHDGPEDGVLIAVDASKELRVES